MQVIIHIKTHSSIEKIEEISKGNFKVWVNAVAVNGKANKRLIEVLAKYFKVAKSQVSIESGMKSKIKKVEIRV